MPPCIIWMLLYEEFKVGNISLMEKKMRKKEWERDRGRLRQNIEMEGTHTDEIDTEPFEDGLVNTRWVYVESKEARKMTAIKKFRVRGWNLLSSSVLFFFLFFFIFSSLKADSSECLWHRWAQFSLNLRSWYYRYKSSSSFPFLFLFLVFSVSCCFLFFFKLSLFHFSSPSFFSALFFSNGKKYFVANVICWKFVDTFLSKMLPSTNAASNVLCCFAFFQTLSPN